MYDSNRRMGDKQIRKRKRRFDGPRKRFRVLTIAHLMNGALTDSLIQEVHARDWDVTDLRFLGSPEIATDYQYDGVLCCRFEDVPDLQKIAPAVVNVGNVMHTPQPMVTVTADYAKVGMLGAEHFLQRGFKNIGGVDIAGAISNNEDDPRTAVSKGLENHLAKNGVTVIPPFFIPGQDAGYYAKRDAFAEWIKALPKPIGLLVWMDRAAARICAWCHEIGISVPEEVAVLGIGNHRYLCELSPCPLSSIDLDAPQQMRQAVDLLEKMMTGKRLHDWQYPIQPAGVVLRKSTDILAMKDPRIAAALRFIWEHLAEPISVRDVAAAVGTSRSTLERHFRAQVGRTVNQELLRKRLEACCELLLTTNLSITDIAPKCGFFSRYYLHRAFQAHHGMSPRQYRLQHAG